MVVKPVLDEHPEKIEVKRTITKTIREIMNCLKIGIDDGLSFENLNNFTPQSVPKMLELSAIIALCV
jgi:hypothetical protein